MNTPEPSRRSSAPCRYLRSKEMYYQSLAPSDEGFTGTHCWCAKTQEAFGPDGAPAGRGECGEGRSCFLN
jgi:hypothetical protein